MVLNRSTRHRPARVWGPMLVLLMVCLCFAGCGDGSASTDPNDPHTHTDATDNPQSTVSWNAGMSLEELLEIAAALGLTFDGDPDKDEVVAALEEETGCGCFGAVCGTGACGHLCGSCPDTGYCIAGACEDDSTCPVKPLEQTEQIAWAREEAGIVDFRYESTLAGSDYNLLRIESKGVGLANLPGPGSYDIALFDPNECVLCVTLLNGCSSVACKENWVARSGGITFDGGLMEARLAGSLHEMKFEEVSVDPDGKFLPLDGGRDRCLVSFVFEADNAVTVIDPDACDPVGTGKEIGAKIGNFTLKNCNGDPVSLHDYCGKKAIWLVGAAGW